MSLDTKSARVAFLLSQPRAGSTMTQKILGSHSMIHTQAEPWVLLHPLHSLSMKNIAASYNHKLYARGTAAFASSLPGGEKEYWSELGDAYSRMYFSILSGKRKTVFLDKTPRYYLVASDLRRMFPDSVVICLIRNPLAVLNSIITTWARSDLYILSRFRQDLLEAPAIFRGLMQDPPRNTICLRYEDLVLDPERHVSQLCEVLGLPFEPAMLDYNRDTKFAMGDRKSVDKLSSPDASFRDSWISGLSDPQVWRLQHEYFERLGCELFSELGYDPAAMKSVFLDSKPSDEALMNTISIDELLDNQPDSLWGLHNLQKEVKETRRIAKAVSESAEYRVGRVLLSPLRRLRAVFNKRRVSGKPSR